ncbi:MAG TPA: hypothetical protein VFL86_09330 [Burkholderiaceae bacterium]|nr:hypothetical protein [Burkholderiaceae bacterium]
MPWNSPSGPRSVMGENMASSPTRGGGATHSRAASLSSARSGGRRTVLEPGGSQREARRDW